MFRATQVERYAVITTIDLARTKGDDHRTSFGGKLVTPPPSWGCTLGSNSFGYAPKPRMGEFPLFAVADEAVRSLGHSDPIIT